MNRRPFTLIELLLVILLVGLILGAVSLQVPKALKGEAFERGVDQVKSRILLAEELMLNTSTDVVLTLTFDNDALVCALKSDKPLDEKLSKEIDRHERIQGIEAVGFNDVYADKVVLHFDSTLGATSKGKLLLYGNKREATLSLKGFPSLIQRGDHVVEASEATYPEAVLSFI